MRTFMTALAATLISAPAWGFTPKDTFDPFRAYGDRIEFEVLRNGEPVGWHVTQFSKGSDGSLRVKAELEIDITFLAFLNYEYRYMSDAVWRDGRLVELETVVDDDGDVMRIQADADAGGLRINGPEGTLRADAGVFPTNHWHPGVLASGQVLNTLTGGLNSVTITKAATETVPTGSGPRPARHHIYSGDLEIETWYDAEGRWVKLRFETDDGSTFEYRCVTCGGGRDFVNGQG